VITANLVSHYPNVIHSEALLNILVDRIDPSIAVSVIIEY